MMIVNVVWDESALQLYFIGSVRQKYMSRWQVCVGQCGTRYQR